LFFTTKHIRPLGIPCQLGCKPAEGWSDSFEDRSHNNGVAFDIPRAIDPGGNLMQPTKGGVDNDLTWEQIRARWMGVSRQGKAAPRHGYVTQPPRS